ncbi:MAG: hypothetical protein IJ680_07225, partial [Paludibacteraceae bacterium]|nr:hypothetical protein [Paludibacteraceae bacterium]
FTAGENTATYTLTYSKIVPLTELTPVSAATTWDWSKLGTSELQLTDASTPAKGTDVIMANLDNMTFTENFTEEMASEIELNGEYMVRGKSYFQGNSIALKTTTPGAITVTFSNTGGSRPYRYVKVNETLSDEGSNSTSTKTSNAILVPAGDVVISGYIPDANDPQARNDDNEGPAMLRIYKVVFTPRNDITAITEIAVKVGSVESSNGINKVDETTYTVGSYGERWTESTHEVIVTPLDDRATYSVDYSGLDGGYGNIVITVTAADGTTKQDYTLTVLPPNQATGLTDLSADALRIEGNIVRVMNGTEARIYNAAGLMLMTTREDINLNLLPAGMYVIKAEAQTLKVVR